MRTVQRVGDDALLVETGSLAATEALHAEILRRLTNRELGVVRDVVPAARTVLLDGIADPAVLAALARDVPGWEVPPLERTDGPLVEIPVRYDGPDLADVAALWRVTPGDVGRLHAATGFRVAFCGFAPGFGYLTGLPPERHVPRRATPRTAVPAGSVALAGEFTGVYPRSSPGGWQLIGTALRDDLWDVTREQPSLLAPGTRVRFVQVDA